MPKIKFSKEDLASGHLVNEPGWYDYVIHKITHKTAKTDGSGLHWVTFKGQSGEMENVLVTKPFSDKAGWASLPLFTALNGGNAPTEGQEFEWDDIQNMKVSAMTRRGEFNGSPINDLVDFRPLKG